MSEPRQSCHLCSEPAYIFDSLGGWCEAHWNEAEATRRADEARATAEAGGPWSQTCPRRLTDWGPWERTENIDTWDIREQMHAGLRARHCSFCGSLHPDDFMRLVTEGWKVGATDKNYKAYLGSPDGRSHETKFYFQHLSVEQKREFVDLYNRHVVQFDGGGFYQFPYFMAPGHTGVGH